MARVRSMTSFSFAFPGPDRWDRPTNASFSASGLQPGRLAQGPEEKLGFAGRVSGFWVTGGVSKDRQGGIVDDGCRGVRPPYQSGARKLCTPWRVVNAHYVAKLGKCVACILSAVSSRSRPCTGAIALAFGAYIPDAIERRP